MIRTRTKVFREQVEDEWVDKFKNFFEDNLDKPWDWGILSGNPNITIDIVLAHPELPWNWDGLSANPNITIEHILAHSDKEWNWGGEVGLSQHKFIKAKQQFIDRKYKEHLSAYRIQQCWNKAISVPTNPMCKRKQKKRL